MSALPYVRYVALPDVWPGRQRPPAWRPPRSPFKAHNWARIERELLQEVARVNGRDVTVALDIRSPGMFRADGAIRADARPTTSRVVVSFTRPDGPRLIFPCDAYAYWQDNVWAIRLSLEALRAMDRYGVTHGSEQYQGFAALPPGRADGMTRERAQTLIAELAGVELDALLYPAVLTMALQRARSRAHPDAGGTTERFQQVEEAARVLEAKR